MAKVILLCGKICCGKSYYTKKLQSDQKAVVLSCDEMMMELSLGDIGQKHDEITERVKQYLYKKSVEIIAAGADVILDFGFWCREERRCVSEFYDVQHIAYEWHYIDISEEAWKDNIRERNRKVAEMSDPSYYIDDGLLSKLNTIFEKPSEDEIDVWYVNSRMV